MTRPLDPEVLAREREAVERRRALLRERPTWVVRATDPPEFSRVWCVIYTPEMYRQGVRGAEDIALMSTCYQRHIVADYRPCEDGVHALVEFLPPVEALAVRPENMGGVVSALRRSGYHARCSDGHGKSYEF